MKEAIKEIIELALGLFINLVVLLIGTVVLSLVFSNPGLFVLLLVFALGVLD